MPPNYSRRSFLKTAAVFGAASPFLAVKSARAAGAQAPMMAYVGTYSSPTPYILQGQVAITPGNGKGIHSFEVNRETGELTPRGVFEMSTSPNCLALNAAGTRLYSTNETEKLPEHDAGSISSFAIDGKTGELKLLNTVTSGGEGPSHLSVHPSGRFVLVANYFGGSVEVIPILPDGSLGTPSDFKQDSGTLGAKHGTSGPPGNRTVSGHDRTHAHMFASDPSGRFVLSVEMGLDQILVWKFDDQTGRLTPNDPASVSLPTGDGPRHFAFHANGRWLYSIQEEASTVAFFEYDGANGRLTFKQALSCLPPGFAGSSIASEILVSPDSRFVYAANRLHNTIARFSIGENGMLTYVGEEWVRGDSTRTFNFDPTGNFLYSCNQKNDAVTLFRVDQKSGALNFTGSYTPVGSPAIIVFSDLAKLGT